MYWSGLALRRSHVGTHGCSGLMNTMVLHSCLDNSILQHSSPPSSPYILTAPSSVITFLNSLQLRNFSLVMCFSVSHPLVTSLNDCFHSASYLPFLFPRYTAVVMPVHYQHGTGQSSCRRVALMITAVWVLAFAVSCPLLFGFNTTGKTIAFTS